MTDKDCQNINLMERKNMAHKNFKNNNFIDKKYF